MLSIGVSELRANLTEFLQKVKAGEVVVITSRGVEVARLVPPHFATTAAREQRVLPVAHYLVHPGWLGPGR
ncbi:MAG: type II toxin-antitoxin system Phd/YefM family antitoxin [Anaerolineae bacterium]